MHANDLIIGSSLWCADARQRIAQAAPRSEHVLVVGPSGSGRTSIARAIHDSSSRAQAPLIPLDCAAMPGRMFEAQLVGHAAGGYLPGIGKALGCLGAAQGGTILLRDIDQLDLDNQRQLVEVLRSGVATPLGSNEEFTVDVRVIATVEESLAPQVKAGTFRADLYELLGGITIRTVSLQDRLEDLEILAEHFLDLAAADRGKARPQLSASALAWMRCYPWPGNVRQLRDMLEEASDSDESVLSFTTLWPIASRLSTQLQAFQGFVELSRHQGFAAVRAKESHRCHKSARNCR